MIPLSFLIAVLYGPPASVHLPQIPKPIIHAAVRAAHLYDVPARLLLAVAKTESRFDPTAVSRQGAIGIMQLMPSTAYRLHIQNPFNIQQSFDGGAAYLHSLLKKYHDSVPLALAAYNLGHGIPRALQYPYVQQVLHSAWEIGPIHDA